jgi:hypothetical protein
MMLQKIPVICAAKSSCKKCRCLLNTSWLPGFSWYIQNTKAGKNIPKDRKMDQVSIKYTIILHCKTLQNLPKFGFLV